MEDLLGSGEVLGNNLTQAIQLAASSPSLLRRRRSPSPNAREQQLHSSNTSSGSSGSGPTTEAMAVHAGSTEQLLSRSFNSDRSDGGGLLAQQDTTSCKLSDGSQGSDSSSCGGGGGGRGGTLTKSASTQDMMKSSSPSCSRTKAVPERVKKTSWYSVLYPSYKSRSADFRKLFRDVPDDERLIVGKYVRRPVGGCVSVCVCGCVTVTPFG